MYDKGVRKALILLFYIAVLIVCVTSSTIALYDIFDEKHDISDVNSYLNAAKELSDATLYLSVGLSMW